MDDGILGSANIGRVNRRGVGVNLGNGGDTREEVM